MMVCKITDTYITNETLSSGKNQKLTFCACKCPRTNMHICIWYSKSQRQKQEIKKLGLKNYLCLQPCWGIKRKVHRSVFFKDRQQTKQLDIKALLWEIEYLWFLFQIPITDNSGILRSFCNREDQQMQIVISISFRIYPSILQMILHEILQVIQYLHNYSLID